MKKQFEIFGLFLLGLTIAAGTQAQDTPSATAPEPEALINVDAEPDLSQAGFVDLFNGKDLCGWSVKGAQMPFEVVDGEIVGTCVPDLRPNSFLCTDKTYTNFIFTAEFKWEVLGNSGIMFRADVTDPADDKKGQQFVFGYQSEMDQNERRWTGGIYGERIGGWKYPLDDPRHEAARAAVTDHYSWNRMTIYANGNVIKTWINGVPCSYLINDERKEGFFGLQVHAGKKGVIHWRSIKVKELGGA